MAEKAAKTSSESENLSLGSTISEDNNGSQEINNGIPAGNNGLYALQVLMKSKQLTRRTKINLYKSRPEVMYGSETWTITMANEERMQVRERKFLRKIFGPTLDERTGQYGIKTNKKLEDYSEINKVQKTPFRTVRLVWEEAPAGKRSAGPS